MFQHHGTEVPRFCAHLEMGSESALILRLALLSAAGEQKQPPAVPSSYIAPEVYEAPLLKGPHILWESALRTCASQPSHL